MTEKSLPLGVENFKVACSCYYVDKTMMLKTLVDLPLTSSLLISRPRRFGKSLALSMVEYFFSIEKGDPELFKDKKIWNCGESYRNQVKTSPVIRLCLKDITVENYEEMINQLTAEISSLYNSFAFKETALSPSELKDIEDLRNGNPSKPLLSKSLYLLTKFLSKTSQNPILLIDEYDAIIMSAKKKGFYDLTIDFFKSLYGAALKGNDYIRFALITGTSEISKDSLFSGVNNLRVYSPFDNGFDDAFGFNQEEVESLLKAYELNEDIHTIQQYYGGYRFGDAVVFNPWSILHFVDSGGKFKTYWSNTGSNDLIGDALNMSNDYVITALSKLLCGDLIETEVDPSVSFADIDKRPSGLFSILVQSGYLTIDDMLDFSRYALRIPNKEIMEVFRKEIRDRYSNVGADSFGPDLRRAFLNGDADTITDLFGRYILSCFSYFDYPDFRNYQALVLGATAMIFDYAVVKNEVNAGLGRCDILVSPKDKSIPAFVIEVKHHDKTYSSERLKSSAKTAIRQIKKMQYVQELIRNGYHEIWLCGFAFKETLVQVAMEKYGEE